VEGVSEYRDRARLLNSILSLSKYGEPWSYGSECVSVCGVVGGVVWCGVVCGVWCVVCGVWCVVCGVW